MGLLLKNYVTLLPESYNNAYKRLMCLKRKFQIDNLLRKDYVVKLSDVEIIKTVEGVWYLSIFITKNPNKPGKIRMVWDCAAKSNGSSLNDFVSRGPDLLKPLFDVLVSFRAGRVAVGGDIAEMFHQINVRENDMHSQIFL